MKQYVDRKFVEAASFHTEALLENPGLGLLANLLPSLAASGHNFGRLLWAKNFAYRHESR